MFSIFSYIMRGDFMQAVIAVLARCFVVFLCLPIHELAHGFVAYKMGDDTAKKQGRLSFSPLAHLDPIGTVMIFLFGIGYAKPVPINISKFKNPKKGMAIVALAGPISNILMAFVSVFLCYLTLFFADKTGSTSTILSATATFFNYSASINITLAVFNLLPIPPLDGSRVLNSVLPYKQYYKIMQYERYIMIGLFALLFLGVLNGPIQWLSGKLFDIISFIPKIIFSF